MIVVTTIEAIRSIKKERPNRTDFYEDDVAFLTGYNGSSWAGDGKNGRFETDLHGNVNILLGGAMISGVIIALILMCYCCHKNVRKHQPQEYTGEYWRAEPEVHSLEVFTTNGHSGCCERQSLGSLNPEESPTIQRSGSGPPPPTYDSLIFEMRDLSPCEKKEPPTPTPSSIPPPDFANLFLAANAYADGIDDEGLPSYEAALKLDADGYV